jgi:hypothetical protein
MFWLGAKMPADELRSAACAESRFPKLCDQGSRGIPLANDQIETIVAQVLLADFKILPGHRRQCSDKTLLPIASIPRNSQRQVASGNAIDQALSADKFHPSIFEDVVTIAQRRNSR